MRKWGNCLYHFTRHKKRHFLDIRRGQKDFFKNIFTSHWRSSYLFYKCYFQYKSQSTKFYILKNMQTELCPYCSRVVWFGVIFLESLHNHFSSFANRCTYLLGNRLWFFLIILIIVTYISKFKSIKEKHVCTF